MIAKTVNTMAIAMISVLIFSSCKNSCFPSSEEIDTTLCIHGVVAVIGVVEGAGDAGGGLLQAEKHPWEAG